MANIGVRPIVLKHFEVIFDNDNYATAIPSCVFTPQQSVQTWRGGTPSDVFTDLSIPTWQCTMRLAADMDNAESFYNYLWENQNQTKECQFRPTINLGATTRKLTAQLVLAVPAFGGDVDGWAEATVTHGVLGQPSYGTN